MPSTGVDEPDRQDPLAIAYERRTTQLYEARGALAEAVSALTVELARREDQSAALRETREYADSLEAEADKQRRHAERFAAETQDLREHVAKLQAELRAHQELIVTLQSMKAVRWTVWPRRLAYRARRSGK
jgi:predicted RNase H-like nuclease (RuvC/YqgF family)